MGVLADLYRPSLALLTDLYELTMAFGYWKSGMADREAVFHLFFRENPFGGGFAVACGLEAVVDYLANLKFDEEETDYLAGLEGADGKPLFEVGFFDFLRRVPFGCDVDAVPEGTVVFPAEPLVRVRGPLIQAQIIETALLNLVNFQTLVATKAARVTMAAGGDPVLEFGLRRAQGIDGGVSASRAAYVGGCASTSNVLAGRLLGIPVKGTHAHSWVMCFDDETEAFDAYAAAMPANCVFLVDTYDSVRGVRHAVETGRRLRAKGHEMIGIRLDSGDLADLSVEARKILDGAGFPGAAIVASNDLDEHSIDDLKRRGAKIGVWGVGTRLVTAHDDPALGGVYKLSAIREKGGPWQDKVKLSEQSVKSTTPGILQVRRYLKNGRAVADVIHDDGNPIRGESVVVGEANQPRRITMEADTPSEELLVPIFRGGRCVYDCPALDEVRRRRERQLDLFGADVKRFVDPQRYCVGLEGGLYDRKMRLIEREAGGSSPLKNI